ncbi:MAG: DUF547 domain-containing protein [Candidatus Cyclobacteriaceae bacterium M2_1C_046]
MICKNLIILSFIFIFSSCLGTGDAPKFNSDKEAPSHQQWDQLVKKYVTPDGWVDYKGFIKDSAKLNDYLQTLKNTPPDDEWKEDEKMAYWLNVYNAFVVKLIIDNYPVESIKDIGPKLSIPTVRDVFTVEYINIGNKELSLNDVEHNILRNMDEPRIHFAVNCASISCPKLRDEAYTAEKLDEQLDDQAEFFLNESGENELSPDQIKISKIFSWFKGDFTKEGTVINYLNKFSDVEINPGADIDYKDYDWSLNSNENKKS